MQYDLHRVYVHDLLSTYPPVVRIVLLAAGIAIGLLAGPLGVGGGVAAVRCFSKSSRPSTSLKISRYPWQSVANMALGEHMFSTRQLLKGADTQLAAWLVGLLASSADVGDGTLTAPVRVIALPATITFLCAGWSMADSIGDAAVFCVVALSLPALFVAPIAAHWSAHAPVGLLRRPFAFCLAAIAVRLLLRL